METNDFSTEYPLLDAEDHAILMHRDAHFGGKFSIMLDYYQTQTKGVQPKFSLKRIKDLQTLEEQYQQNLAGLFLTAQEAQEVADSLKMYRTLRAIYTVKNPSSTHPRLIADLILTEEEEPQTEIAAIVAEKGAIVPSLLSLIQNDLLYQPLFPGYGEAPFLAIQCLQQIGDKRAIISLFEILGVNDFFTDEEVIAALKAIGAPAKEFLLNILPSKPINQDNEKAIIALLGFKDEEIAKKCLHLLQQKEIQQDTYFATYLVLGCEELKQEEDRQQFRELAKQSAVLPLYQDIKAVIQTWK